MLWTHRNLAPFLLPRALPQGLLPMGWLAGLLAGWLRSNTGFYTNRNARVFFYRCKVKRTSTGRKIPGKCSYRLRFILKTMISVVKKVMVFIINLNR